MANASGLRRLGIMAATLVIGLFAALLLTSLDLGSVSIPIELLMGAGLGTGAFFLTRRG